MLKSLSQKLQVGAGRVCLQLSCDTNEAAAQLRAPASTCLPPATLPPLGLGCVPQEHGSVRGRPFILYNARIPIIKVGNHWV